ncbi:hypothetical protein ART_2167 [Arthrobacter sp. PAMC 25486]|uniref:hypothetical protein n=1 Tax=Arthrobacter sp. PAMC 25486 TaxID=1494608 RepID=UPI0005362FC1|nr:hypothetical protein [Arthrobacter sp. PAMC 25486]AIY01766.1 hypothetical protein ART_2167 [Arthrobacter sp. PAMC 25486]
MGEMMFGVNWMELLILVGTIGVGVTVVTYLALRLFVWSKAESKSLEYIRRHALWTGVIAWAFSSLAGANRAGIYDPDQYYPDHWSTVPWLAVIAPSVAVVAVHAIGQSTWPAPKSPKRSAVLEFRRTRDYIEPALGWTVAGIFTLTAVVVGFLFFAPESVGPNSVTLGDYGQSIQTRFGRAPGYVLATALGVALTILVVGTAAVMRLIASRRSLEALSAEANKTLRTIGMNRLLRVSATVASGLAAVAGNYLAQPAPDSTATSWVNWLAIGNMLVLIAMLFWKPPFLASPTDDAGYNALFNSGASPDPSSGDGPAAAKLNNTAGLLAPAAGAVGLVAGWFTVPWFGWLGPMTLMLVFVLLSHLGLELLLRNNYATPGTPRARLKAAVPRSLPILAVVAGIGLIPTIAATSSLNRGGGYDWPGFGGSSPHFLVPLICVLAILTAGAGATAVVLRRPGLNDASELLERTLRRRSLFRIARTVAGGLFAILAAALFNLGTAPTYGGQSADQSLAMVGGVCIVAALTLCFYPVRAFTPAGFIPPVKNSTSLGK